MNVAASLFDRHRERFEKARETCRTRASWSPFAEQPSLYAGHANARAAGEKAFTAHLGQRFEIDQPSAHAWVGEEVSPYTQEPLKALYPLADLDALFTAASVGIPAWSAVSPEIRAGVLLEVVERIYRERLFELTYAVMHTTGQSFNMAYAGSGVNALDRGIEALVYAMAAMDAVTRDARWERSFGSATIALDKHYRLIPRGVAVCFACASFPTWNAFPSMIASLATGNAVIVKPHPATVLPMAISIEVFRGVLRESGFDPNLVTMAIDTTVDPMGQRIIKHPSCAIVDFTGSARFGQWVEKNAHPALCFTETSGCNAVVIESCVDLDAVIRSLATTLSLFSGQMCTSPQNIYVPAAGVRVGSGDSASVVPFDEVVSRLAKAVEALGNDPKKASMIMAAIQSPSTLDLLNSMKETAEELGALVLAPHAYAHPEFPQARTSTPLMMNVSPSDRALYSSEQFGPISFVIKTTDANDALLQATSDVHEGGGLTAFLYSTDPAYVDKAEDAFARAGSQLTINLTGPMPLNFAAA
ncbi:MAG: aldehyde dehydrogenase family protein, partial [Vicinamibacteria bacterium]